MVAGLMPRFLSILPLWLLNDSDGCSEDHDDGDNKSVKTNSLSENEDKDHSYEDIISLGIGSDTSVTSNTNGKTSSERTETSLLLVVGMMMGWDPTPWGPPPWGPSHHHPYYEKKTYVSMYIYVYKYKKSIKNIIKTTDLKSS